MLPGLRGIDLGWNALIFELLHQILRCIFLGKRAHLNAGSCWEVANVGISNSGTGVGERLIACVVSDHVIAGRRLTDCRGRPIRRGIGRGIGRP